jgi:D-alanyl-lipoteichoic acid acyltransferase DltB (MBOAT superfamily)
VLFNSVDFIFRLLPATLAGFWILLRLGNRPAALWLLACSLFFYGWWSPRHVALLLLSIAFNYGIGLALSAPPVRRADAACCSWPAP